MLLPAGLLFGIRCLGEQSDAIQTWAAASMLRSRAGPVRIRQRVCLSLDRFAVARDDDRSLPSADPQYRRSRLTSLPWMRTRSGPKMRVS